MEHKYLLPPGFANFMLTGLTVLLVNYLSIEVNNAKILPVENFHNFLPTGKMLTKQVEKQYSKENSTLITVFCKCFASFKIDIEIAFENTELNELIKP